MNRWIDIKQLGREDRDADRQVDILVRDGISIYVVEQRRKRKVVGWVSTSPPFSCLFPGRLYHTKSLSTFLILIL